MKFLSVETARGVAAILVVLVHASDMLAAPKYFGAMPFDGLFGFAHAGVDFFFVLSGFIIFYVHRQDLGNPSRLGAYLKRRFVRIYPTYWTILFIFGLILAVSPTKDGYERNIVAVITSTFLIPVPERLPILGVAWTLQHEILFYALFSALFINRTVGKTILGVWATLIAWNMLTGSLDVFPASFLFSMFNIEFFFGIGVAVAVRRWPIFHPRLMLACGAALFFATGLVEAWGPYFPVQWWPPHMFYATGAAMALYGMVGAEDTGHLKSIPAWAVSLGSASYSIYLLHTIVIMFLQQGILIVLRYTDLPLHITFLAVVGTTILICERFSHFIEQPLLRWSRRAISRRPVQRA
jgi:exopolysaccharide production protein ExoZ